MNRLIPILIMVFAASGCAHTYQPRSDTFKLDAIPEFTAPVEISVINAQTDTTERVHLRNMGSTFSGNPKSWTDAAVELTKRELIKRQAAIKSSAQRTLELSIVSFEGEAGFASFHYITILKVKTGSGYEGTYTGDNRSPATVFRAADGSVMRAVTEMFRDKNIVKYITEGS
ncbi:hypothetical protein [Kaarinaea lacus]